MTRLQPSRPVRWANVEVYGYTKERKAEQAWITTQQQFFAAKRRQERKARAVLFLKAGGMIAFALVAMFFCMGAK